MPSFTIKVPNDDDGHDLGDYESDYLPRVGDPFVLMHPRVNPRKDHPFVGTVSLVTHDAYAADGPRERGYVETTVWLTEEAPAPQLYCDCTEAEQVTCGVDERGDCENCGRARRPQ